MRRLFWIIIVALLLWCGYWAAGAYAVRKGIQSWIAERQAEGWSAELADLSTSGFPMRFNITLDKLALSDPASGFAWRAPKLLVASRAYMPNHLLAKWPRRQSFSWRGEPFEVEAERLVTSLRLAATPDLALGSFRAEAGRISVLLPDGGRGSAEKAFLATRQSVARANAHDLFLDAGGVGLPDALRKAIDPAHTLPDLLEAVKADLTASFDRPLDRKAFENAAPRLHEIDLRNLSVHWGGLELAASGAIRLGVDGLPEGRVQLRARGWQQMLRLATAAGLVNPGQAETIGQALRNVGTLSDDETMLEVPLELRGGWASLGGVPIGPVPKF